jgi:hypothetical protein
VPPFPTGLIPTQKNMLNGFYNSVINIYSINPFAMSTQTNKFKNLEQKIKRSVGNFVQHLKQN